MKFLLISMAIFAVVSVNRAEDSQAENILERRYVSLDSGTASMTVGGGSGYYPSRGGYDDYRRQERSDKERARRYVQVTNDKASSTVDEGYSRGGEDEDYRQKRSNGERARRYVSVTNDKATSTVDGGYGDSGYRGEREGRHVSVVGNSGFLTLGGDGRYPSLYSNDADYRAARSAGEREARLSFSNAKASGTIGEIYSSGRSYDEGSEGNDGYRSRRSVSVNNAKASVTVDNEDPDY